MTRLRPITPYERRERERTRLLVFAVAIFAAIVLLSIECGKPRRVAAEDDARFTPASRGVLSRHLDLAALYWPPEALPTLARVIQCESRGDTLALGTYHERGLLQIHPIHQWRADRTFGAGADLFDAEVNLVVGAELFAEAGWAPWYSSRRCWG